MTEDNKPAWCAASVLASPIRNLLALQAKHSVTLSFCLHPIRASGCTLSWPAQWPLLHACSLACFMDAGMRALLPSTTAHSLSCACGCTSGNWLPWQCMRWQHGQARRFRPHCTWALLHAKVEQAGPKPEPRAGSAAPGTSWRGASCISAASRGSAQPKPEPRAGGAAPAQGRAGVGRAHRWRPVCAHAWRQGPVGALPGGCAAGAPVQPRNGFHRALGCVSGLKRVRLQRCRRGFGPPWPLCRARPDGCSIFAVIATPGDANVTTA